MAYNGDGGLAKRPRTDMDGIIPRMYAFSECFRENPAEADDCFKPDPVTPMDVESIDHSDSYKDKEGGFELRRKRPVAEPNNVLLFTVFNPVYPITVDVLHTICSPHGQVLRIVVFKKNGVQAMVEFDNIEIAKRVKEALNGADIYSGCCTLKIEFAKPSKLNVYKNDMDSWDYTNPSGPEKPVEPQAHRQAPLLQEPRFGAPPQLYRGPGGTGGGFSDYDDDYTNGRPSAYGDYVNERFPAPGDKLVPSSPISPRMFLDVLTSRRFMMKGPGGGRDGVVPPPPRGPSYNSMASPNGVQGGSGCVLMAYGLDPQKANPDKLFNLFCLYGNVIRIKFLKTKEGCAMIQMGDSISVERCINHLKNAPIFGGILQLGFSKQPFLSEVAQPYTLPDNSASFKEFTNNKNNRFLNAAMASKNRITGPAKILHFFNTPPDLTDEQLSSVIAEKCEKKPSQIRLFPKKGDKSSSGLMEFDTIEDAVNCLIICNHMPVKNESKFPYMMKLCFSSSKSILGKEGGAKDDSHMQ